MKRRKRFLGRGLALTDALAMVAVIALASSILLPTLAKTREAARRSMCADNMHHLMMSVLSYANDHNGIGPTRGWKTYTVAETMREVYGKGGHVRSFANLGLLYKKWIGGQHNMLYCPLRYDFRDMPSNGMGAGGWKSVFDPVPIGYWSFGGYDYGVILAQRRGGLSSPDFSGLNPFPRETWSCSFASWVSNWEMKHHREFQVPDFPAVATDWFIGMSPEPIHGRGMNVMHSDGHVSCHDVKGSRSNMYDAWYKVSLKQ